MQKTNKQNSVYILMPAYNVENFIEDTVKRIPVTIWPKIDQLVIVNDGSKDRTLQKIRQLKKKYSKIHIINKKNNEGYSQVQKDGFDYCLKMGSSAVVLLHGDGQYAPEIMEKLLLPIEKNRADIVQGSRILGGGALNGNMPFYKYIANCLLSRLENVVYRMNLREYHSGYMLYSRKALKTIPYKKLSDTFHIDGEMLIVGHDYGLRIKEIPIPTHYGKEKSNLKPIKYGFDVLKIMFAYKLGKYRFNNN